MATINANHVNTFLKSASSVLQNCCMLTDLQIGKPYMRDASFSNNEWVIIIGLTGELKGQVLISFDIDAVLDIASKMCMMPIEQMDELSSSAICELGNMILGNAATLLAANNVGVDITPPKLSNGMGDFDSDFSSNICIPFTYDGGSKEVSINLLIEG